MDIDDILERYRTEDRTKKYKNSRVETPQPSTPRAKRSIDDYAKDARGSGKRDTSKDLPITPLKSIDDYLPQRQQASAHVKAMNLHEGKSQEGKQPYQAPTYQPTGLKGGTDSLETYTKYTDEKKQWEKSKKNTPFAPYSDWLKTNGYAKLEGGSSESSAAAKKRDTEAYKGTAKPDGTPYTDYSIPDTTESLLKTFEGTVGWFVQRIARTLEEVDAAGAAPTFDEKGLPTTAGNTKRQADIKEKYAPMGQAAVGQIGAATQEGNKFTKTLASTTLAFGAGMEGYGTAMGQIGSRARGDENPVETKEWGQEYGKVAMELKGAQKVAGDMANSLGNMLIPQTIGRVTGANAIGSIMLGAGAGANAYTRAREEGKSDAQSLAYGLFIGVSEAGLEYLLSQVGGLGRSAGITKSATAKILAGGGSGKLVDMAIPAVAKSLTSVEKVLARLASKPALQAIARVTIDGTKQMASEALEEGLQDIFEAVYRDVAFDEKRPWGEVFEEALYSAFIGALMPLGLNASSNIANLQANYNQAYVDKLTKEFNQSEKAQEVGAQAKEAADQINTPPIFENKQEVSNPEIDAIKKDIEIFNDALEDASDEARPMLEAKLVELNAELADKTGLASPVDYRQETPVETQGQEVPLEVPNATAVDTLQDIPNETARYTPVAEMTQQESEVVTLAKDGFNRNVTIVDSIETPEGTPKRVGAYKPETGEIYLARNATDGERLNYLLAHEITHSIEGTQEYRDLVNYLRDDKVAKGRDMKAADEKARAIWDAKIQAKLDESPNLKTKAAAQSEVVAEYIQDLVTPDADGNMVKLEQLATQNKSIAEKILTWLKNLRTKVFGTKAEKEVAKTIELFQNALKAKESQAKAEEKGKTQFATEQARDIYERNAKSKESMDKYEARMTADAQREVAVINGEIDRYKKVIASGDSATVMTPTYMNGGRQLKGADAVAHAKYMLDNLTENRSRIQKEANLGKVQDNVDPVTGEVKKSREGEIQYATEKTPQLPQELRNAKPRYGYQDKTFTLEFESDIDKAIYIVSGKGKSKSHDAYLDFITTSNPQITEDIIQEHGKTMRDLIKTKSKQSESGETVSIPNFNFEKAVVATPTKKTPAAKDAEAMSKAKVNMEVADYIKMGHTPAEAKRFFDNSAYGKEQNKIRSKEKAKKTRERNKQREIAYENRTPAEIWLDSALENVPRDVSNRKDIVDNARTEFAGIKDDLTLETIKGEDIKDGYSTGILNRAKKVVESIAPHIEYSLDELVGESSILDRADISNWHVSQTDFDNLKAKFGDVADIRARLKRKGITYDRKGSGQATDQMVQAIIEADNSAFGGIDTPVNVDASQVAEYLLNLNEDMTEKATTYKPYSEGSADFEGFVDYTAKQYYDEAVSQVLEAEQAREKALADKKKAEKPVEKKSPIRTQSEAITKVGNKTQGDTFTAEEKAEKDRIKQARKAKAEEAQAKLDEARKNQGKIDQSVEPYIQNLENLDEYGAVKDKTSSNITDVEAGKTGTDGKEDARLPATLLGIDMDIEANERLMKKQVAGEFTYEQTSNAELEIEAREAVKKNRKQVELELDNNFNNIRKLSPDKAIAYYAALSIDAKARGDYDALMQIYVDSTLLSIEYGRGVQAINIFGRMTGVNQIKVLQRMVDRMNAKNQRRIEKGQMKAVQLTEGLQQDFAMAETDAEREAVMLEVKKDLASQIPSTLSDKIQAWRYLSMLFSLPTHIRNVVGNNVFMANVIAKDVMKYGIEAGLSKKNINHVRTTALKSSAEAKAIASRETKLAKGALQSTGKYNPQSDLNDFRKIFNNRKLEALRKFNNNALEREDWLNLKWNHYRTLSKGLTINGFGEVEVKALDNYHPAPLKEGETITDMRKRKDLLTKIREDAKKEAWRNTYRDESALATWLQETSNQGKFAQFAMDALVPFKKTPINLVRRGIEYSPIGLVTGLVKGAALTDTAMTFKDSKGIETKYTASDVVDQIASGVSGSALTAMGFVLGMFGKIKGSREDDKTDEKLDAAMGKQKYSLIIGGKSYTIHWLNPQAMPLFVGVSLYNLVAKHNDGSMMGKEIYEAIKGLPAPMYDTTVLQGVSKVLDAVAYAKDGERPTALLIDMTQNYASQFVPTIFGQAARTFDKTSYGVGRDETSVLPNDALAFIQTAANKIGQGKRTSPVYLDLFGEEQDTGNLAQRAFQNFVNPSRIKEIKNDPVINAMVKLNKIAPTGTSVVPTSYQRTLRQGGGTYPLSITQQTEFNKAAGKAQRQAAQKYLAAHKEISEETAKGLSSAMQKVYEKEKEKFIKNNNLVSTTKITEKKAKAPKAPKAKSPFDRS